MNFQEARKKLPQFDGLDDATFLDLAHERYYPKMDKAELASRLGYKLPEPAVEPRGTMRAMADTAVQFGKGAVTGVRMMSDVFGADNAVSGGLRSADDALASLLSATAKQDQAEVAAIMQEADGKGWMEQIGLGLKAAGVAPGALLAQAAGTAVPTILSAMGTGGAGPVAAAARFAAPALIGGAQGVGATKGAIYDNTKQELLKAGATPAEAEARAADQQSYSGDSIGQIALGGGLGVLAGSTGMERVVSGLRGGVSKAAPGIMARMGTGALTEAVPELLQGGQEKYATNSALNNEGFNVDPMSGVVANATMEGMAGAGMGAAFGIPRPAVTPQQAEADAIRSTELVPESGAMTRAVNAGTEAKARAVEMLPDNFSATPTATMGKAVSASAGMGFNMGNLPNGTGAPAEMIDQAELDSLVETERRDQQVMQAQIDQERQKQAEIEAAFAAKPELDATTAAVEQAATIDAPNAMQAAFNKLADKTIGTEPEAPPAAPKEPRIVARTPDMKPMPLELAELQVDMDGGEVVRVQNANGKFGYVVVPKPTSQAKPAKVTASTVKTATGAMDGDVLNKQGNPFTNFFSANTEASKQGAGFEPVKLRDNAFVVRKIEPNQAASPVETAQPAIESVAQEGAISNDTLPLAKVSPADLPNDQKPDATDEQMAEVNEAEYQKSIKEGIKQRLGLVKPVVDDQRKTPFKSFLREYGIAPEHTSDIAGRNRFKANNMLPATFRKGGMGLDDLVERAIERGFMTEADRGDQSKLIAMIQDEIAGDVKVSSEFADEDSAAQTERAQRLEIEGEANKLGLPFSSDTNTDHLASMVYRVQRRMEKEVDASYNGRGSLKSERVLANAREVAARIERKRAQYAQQSNAFDAATIAEQDALIELFFDADGNPVISRKDDRDSVGEWYELNPTWVNQNESDAGANQDTGQVGAPVTRESQEGSGDGGRTSAQAQQGSPEAPAGQSQEGLTAPTRADVLAQQDRVDNAQALDDRAQIDAEASRQTLTQQTAPEQRKDTSVDMFGEEKAALESAKREADAVAKNEAKKDPNQGSMFDEPVEPEAQATTSAPETPIAKPEAAPSITQADVDAASKQAIQQIESTIDGMKADAVQRVAVRFLPTMGMKVPVGKARIKAAMTDPKMNLLAAAGELSIELPKSIKAALEAQSEGRVEQAEQPSGVSMDEQVPTAKAEDGKLSEKQARNQMEWRSLGQKDGVKTHALFFFESKADKGTGRAMGYGQVSKPDWAGNWTVDGVESNAKFTSLTDAKNRAETAALERLKADGYIDTTETIKPATPAQPAARTPNPDELRAQADLQNALADLGDILGKNFRMNMMPEQEAKLLPVMVKLFDAAFRLGYHKFMDAAKFTLDKIRAALGDDAADGITLEHLQGAYISMSSGKSGVDSIRAVSNIEAKTEIEAHTAKTDNERNGETDVPSTNTSVERDSPVASTEPTVGDSIQDDATGTSSRTGEAGGRTTGSAGRGQQDGSGVSTGSAATGRKRSNQRLPSTGEQPELTSIVTGADFSEPGGDSGITGVPAEPIAASHVDAVADQRTPGLKNTVERNKANKAPVVLSDIESIKATLPQLLPGQQEDVKLAETRFAKANGYGMLFTNGTGTGKTFSGLGIIKRYALQGKTNTLIVAPDSKIASDWMESAKLLGLDVTLLEDTQDAGKGIVITTYANLGANDKLATRQWDLVAADEAHSLMQAADGEPTGYLHNLRAITYHPDGAGQRHTMLNRDKLNRAASLGEEILALEKMVAADSTTDAQRAGWEAKSEKLQAELGALRAALAASQTAMLAEVKDRQGAARTRLVALSATPFAYEKTIDWANGYLFDYNEGQTSDKTEFRGYNQGSNKDRYMMQHFGYSMRYNKMTRPDANVDSGLMQRQWNANLKKSGALSGRMLDVVPDYDRRFILVDSAIGNRIDEALEWVSEQRQAEKGGQGPFSILGDAINEQFKYQAKRYLLEAIKADAAIPIVKAHMAMGRKVVVFHDYKKGGGFNPFRINSSDSAIKSALGAFNEKFSDLVNHPFADMPSPIDIFSRDIPGVLLINGDEKKADLLKRYKSFQDDSTGPQVMLVQSAKNKGWSGHDTTGKHQRVLINLGQPTAPTLAIQQEGRIYRTGQASDAIMRYMNTGTNWERWTFASTIATRASTAENLGMGEMARALKDSFIQSFEESDAYEPGHEGEGKGGKERDQAANDAITEYDRAKTFYFGQQKKNSRTKAQEGADYFATPEPVGLKMVQWLDARGGESVMEPSAGHGAISRWLPDNTMRTAIEPSFALRSKLALVMEMKETGDRIIGGTFEDHHISNKYDGIVMNPPFGTAGRTAVDHLAKAATHLRDGGRIVALLPDGPSANAKFDKWFYESSEKPVKQLLTHPTLGSIYKGDTVSIEGYGGTKFTAVAMRDGLLEIKSAGYGTVEPMSRITAIEPTGPRATTFKPAEGLSLVATIKLPTITFERAGTAVATRIVVIEKNGTNVMERQRDFSDITDIKELFDKLENLDFSARAKPVEVAPVEPVAAEKPSKADKPAKVTASAGDEVTIGGTKYEIEIYTTNAGKEKRGVWMASKAEAAKYSSRTFTHSSNKGKWFVDEYWFPKDAEIIKPDASFSRAGVDQPSRILEVNEANREKTNRLQAILKKQGYDFAITPVSLPVDVADDAGGRADESSPKNSFALAERIARVFGKEVVWVSADGPFAINGVVVPGALLSKQVFINADGSHPSHVILGHELTHHMEKDAPGAYKALMKAINGLLRNHDAYRAKYGLEGAPNEFVAKEMIGDLMGDNFDKREFWNLVAQESNGTYFRIIANSISKWLTGLLMKLKQSGLGSHQFVTDVQEARAMLAKAVAEYSKVTTPTAPDSGVVNFSRSAVGRNSWDGPEASQFDDLVYKLQDKQIDTKRVVDAIKAKAGALADEKNVYLQEELFHGRAAARTEDFVNKELGPLVNMMKMRNIDIPMLDEYLHARHAEEANELIAERNPDILDGGSGMTTQAARDYLAKLTPADRTKLDAVAAKVDAILANTRQLYADYDLESQDKVDGWGAMFKHYVPLMREDKDGGMGIGQGFSIKGKEVKGRTGSTRKVVDILANIALQRERAIVRGEKNRVATALVGLVKTNPNKAFWQVGPPPAMKVYDAASNSVVERQDPLYKSRDNVVVAKIKGKDGFVTEQAVTFSEDDPRAVRMAASLKNLDAAQLEGLLGVSAKITRYFAAINTQYNPIFGTVNLVRDIQGALFNLTSTPLKGKATSIAGHTMSALKGIYLDARAARDGKTPSSKWAALWEEFQDEGGQTGFRDLFANSADRAKAIERELNPTAWMDSTLGKVFTANGALKVPLAVAQKKATGIFDWLSDYNLAMENAVRLAAYKVALEQGMSKQQAASLGKNLTVNFNRKGQVGQQAGALYAFFNASMQGTARLGQTLFDMEPGKPKTIRMSATGKKIIYGGVMLGAMQALLLAAAGFDDEEPPDFVRERSLIIPTGGKTYITIPMPLGLHVLPNMGRIPMEFAMGGFKDPVQHVAKVIGLFAGSFNPIGGGASLVQMLAPTAIDPMVAIAENKDWTGKPIAKTSYNKATPGHLLTKDTATAPAKMLSEAINFMSGGTEYTAGVLSPTPDQIDYLFGQVTGGVGREASKVQQSISATVAGEDLPIHKVPLVGRFYGDTDTQSAQSGKFYSAINKLNVHEAMIKGLRKDGKSTEAAKYLQENPEARLFVAANLAEREVQKLRAAKRALVAKDAPADQVKAMETRINERMTRFNLTMQRLREKEAA